MNFVIRSSIHKTSSSPSWCFWLICRCRGIIIFVYFFHVDLGIPGHAFQQTVFYMRFWLHTSRLHHMSIKWKSSSSNFAVDFFTLWWPCLLAWSGVIFDCIDSWSLPSSLLWYCVSLLLHCKHKRFSLVRGNIPLAWSIILLCMQELHTSPWEILKTTGMVLASGPNINAWKTMFDPILDNWLISRAL